MSSWSISGCTQNKLWYSKAPGMRFDSVEQLDRERAFWSARRRSATAQQSRDCRPIYFGARIPSFGKPTWKVQAAFACYWPKLWRRAQPRLLRTRLVVQTAAVFRAITASMRQTSAISRAPPHSPGVSRQTLHPRIRRENGYPASYGQPRV